MKRITPTCAAFRRGFCGIAPQVTSNSSLVDPQHGDAKLTELLVTLADSPKARSASVYDRCMAVYEGLGAR